MRGAVLQIAADRGTRRNPAATNFERHAHRDPGGRTDLDSAFADAGASVPTRAPHF
jgi:hypothetical protein